MRFPLVMSLLAALVTAAPVMSADVGTASPAISITTLSNFEQPNIDLAKLKGQVVYVDFWASWCGPCQRSFPELDKLYAKHVGHGFEIIGVNVDEDVKDAQDFLKKYPVTFPIATDPKGASAEAFKVKGMPSGYLIDKQGVVRHVVVGFAEGEAEHLDKLITQLVAE